MLNTNIPPDVVVERMGVGESSATAVIHELATNSLKYDPFYALPPR